MFWVVRFSMMEYQATWIKLFSAPSESAIRSKRDNFQFPRLIATLEFLYLCSPFCAPCF